ncbi:MAG: histidine phosphatase family protein [Polyangiales bacterium]
MHPSSVKKLALIKHALPELVAGVPSQRWQLGAAGRAQIPNLAARLRDAGFDHVVTSDEDKAVETGRLLAGALGLPVSTLHGLHEQRRESEPVQADRSVFEARIARFFQAPAALVFGEETADTAHARFHQALSAAATAVSGNLAIVAHGTVIALLVARANDLDPWPLWHNLACADFITITWPGLQLVASP